MAGLHLRARPGQHRLAREALGMVEPRHRRLDLAARLAPTTVQKVSETFLLAGTRTRRRSDSDRIEHEAVRCRQAARPVEGRRIGDRAAAADEGAAVGLGLGVARATPELSSTKCASSMSGSPGARLRRRAKMTLLLGADLGLDEHLREGRMGVVGRLPAPAPARRRRSPR